MFCFTYYPKMAPCFSLTLNFSAQYYLLVQGKKLLLNLWCSPYDSSLL